MVYCGKSGKTCYLIESLAFPEVEGGFCQIKAKCKSCHNRMGFMEEQTRNQGLCESRGWEVDILIDRN